MFYNILGGGREPVHPAGFFDNTCRVCIFGQDWFISAFAAIVIIIFLVDLVQSLRNDETITDDLWRSRVQGESEDDRFVSVVIEERTKITVTAIVLEHAALLLVSVFTKQYVLAIPWLAVQTLVLVLEIFLLLLRILFYQSLPSRKELAFLVIMMFSYVQVFCFYRALRVATYPTTTCKILAPDS